MQIKIDLKILIFILIFHLTGQIKIYILLMIFACFHELGHLIIGAFLGFKITLFEVKPIGFSVSFFNKIQDYNMKILNGNLLELKKFFVYIAGPLINIIFSIVISFLRIDILLKQELIYINLIVAFINLLPIYPLDGGRITKSTLSLIFGLEKSYKLTEKISWTITIIILAVSSILVLKIKNYGFIVMLGYLLYVRIKSSKIVQKKLNFYSIVNRSNC